MSVMYHYTSAVGYTGILASKSIRPSLRANNPKDARFGDGQYLSDIVPGTKRPGQLSKIFFGMPYGWRRFTHHIDVDTAGLAVTHGRQHVYCIQNAGSLDIQSRLVSHGQIGGLTVKVR